MPVIPEFVLSIPVSQSTSLQSQGITILSKGTVTQKNVSGIIIACVFLGPSLPCFEVHLLLLLENWGFVSSHSYMSPTAYSPCLHWVAAFFPQPSILCNRQPALCLHAPWGHQADAAACHGILLKVRHY